MKRRQRRPVLELNQTQTASHGEHLQSKHKQLISDSPGQNVPANPLANLLCHYNSDSDTEDSKRDVRKLDDQVNNFLKEIQLIAPKESVSNDSSNSNSATNTTGQAAHQPNQQALMWRECLDESSGYPYYWHIETNEVTWEMPEELRLWKNSNKVNSVMKPPSTQESHWVDFSSITYQQSHENIPEGMIPREVVARNRNRYIRNDAAQKRDTQTDQETANTSDAMDDDSDDGKIEMITSYGSEESDSDTTENNHLKDQARSIAVADSKTTNSTTKLKSFELIAPSAPSQPQLTRNTHNSEEYVKKGIENNTKSKVSLDAKLRDRRNKIRQLKNQAKLLKLSGPDETSDCNKINIETRQSKESILNTLDDTSAKKEAELDFRVSLVPGYDEDSDAEEEIEVKEERRTLFPIPQDEDIAESASPTHKSINVQSKQTMLDDNRVTDNSSDDSNTDFVEKKNHEVQEGEENMEKSDSKEETSVKTEEDVQKSNKFLDTLHGRNKYFQRKRRIAFDVTSAQTKANDDTETNKVENSTEIQPAEVAPPSVDIEDDAESLKESHTENEIECNTVNEDIAETVDEHSNEELNHEEQTNPPSDTAADAKNEEEEVNSLTQIILEKLKFLSEGKQSVSPVQMMAIQLQTLFAAHEGGYLEKNYLRKWLTDTGLELERLEQDAAPPGWLCQWDRSHKRYYYQNATTGVTQWTYPDTGIAGGTEEMEICSTPPPAEQEEITTSAEADKSKSKPKSSEEEDEESCEDITNLRSSDIEAPPPPQISNPSPPPPPRIYAEDLKKDKRKRDKCNETLGNKKKRLEEEIQGIMDPKQLENPSISLHPSAAPVSPQPSAVPSIANAEPLPPGVDLTEAPYEIPATALKRIIYGAVQPQANTLYDASARDPTVPILGHPAAIVQEHYLQYPAYHQHLHAPAALVLPHKHGVQPAIQLIPDYTPIYTNHKVIEKPPVKTAKESLVSALDSFYNDIARIENNVPEQITQRQDVPVTEVSALTAEEMKVDGEQEAVPVEVTMKEKRRKKARIGISKKHKEVSSMVAKWQKAQQNFEDNT